MKMTLDNPTNQQANMNYEHLCDLQILLAFACILILLEFIFILIKVAHMKDVFLCNLVVVIKVCKGDSYNMYCDLCSRFITHPFLAWKSLLEGTHENLNILNFNFKFQHLAYEVNGKHRWVMNQDSKTMMLSFVNENVFVVVESQVKN